ncbi:hypothetical protein HNO89_002011 [Sporosarcina luteola]|nr:hypothetical protein [Sporosarcina luteola]
MDDKFLSNFVDYLRAHVKAEKNVEFVIFWAGDGEQTMLERMIPHEEIEPSILDRLQQEEYVRLQFVY